MNIKKSILLLMALMLVLSYSALVVMAEDALPILKLTVKVDPTCKSNVTYIAQLSPVPTNVIPVITFYCDSTAIAKVAVNNSGTAIYSFWQKTGKYQAVATWENTPTPIKSNIVDYIVPIIP